MHQTPGLKGKQQFPGITVFHVLPFCMIHSLTGNRIFQFYRHYRQTIDKQNYINGILFFQAVMNLTGDGKNVLFIQCLTGLVHTTGRLEETHGEFCRGIHDSVAQNIQHSMGIQIPIEFFQKSCFNIIAMLLAQLGPLCRLAFPEESEQQLGINGKLPIVVMGIAFDISAVVKQAVFNFTLKGDFFGFDCHS